MSRMPARFCLRTSPAAHSLQQTQKKSIRSGEVFYKKKIIGGARLGDVPDRRHANDNMRAMTCKATRSSGSLSPDLVNAQQRERNCGKTKIDEGAIAVGVFRGTEKLNGNPDTDGKTKDQTH